MAINNMPNLVRLCVDLDKYIYATSVTLLTFLPNEQVIQTKKFYQLAPSDTLNEIRLFCDYSHSTKL